MNTEIIRDDEHWCDVFEKGRKAGIKEVVEFIEQNRQRFFIFDDLYHMPNWQAKLKEWELNADQGTDNTGE